MIRTSVGKMRTTQIRILDCCRSRSSARRMERRFIKGIMEKRIQGRQLGTTSVWLIACLHFGLGTPFLKTGFGQKNPIAAGREHSLVLRSDGQVISFGDNGIGQLGNGTTTSTLTNAADFISGLTNVTGLTSGGLNAEDSHS